MEEENKEIADFIKNNPFPDDDKFWEIQFDMARFYARHFGGAHCLGHSDDYRMVKKIYENILDKDVVKECGRELYEKGGMREMVRCCDLMDLAVQRNYEQGDNKNKYNRMVIEPLARLIDFYWEGIGEWKA